jgi:hypothetical protein
MERKEERVQQLQDRPASASTPLPGATLYRPGGKVALTLVFVPILGACAAAGVFLEMQTAIPIWLPGAMLLWVLLMPAFWLALKTVRTSPFGIAAGRPWRVWREIPWGSIAKVERHGPRLRVTSREYVRISFNPGMLHAGGELRRFLLSQLPPELLDDSLRDEARRIAMADSGPSYPGPLPSILRTRPRALLRIGAALVALGALGAAPLAAVKLTLVPGVPVAAGAVALAFGGMLAFAWLSQQVTLSEVGISVAAFPSGRARGMQWSQVVLLEFTRHGRVIRLTGKGARERMRCPGPRIMAPLDAAVYRAFLKRHLRDRHVMESRRFWLL